MTPNSKNKRGRKARDEIDVCQSAYWAWGVRYELNLDFSKIERMLDPTCFEHREDIGGYKQPQLWRKYGVGKVSPTGNGRSRKNAVQLADKFCPGSKDLFHSVFWTLIRTANPSKELLRQLSQSLSLNIRTELIRLAQKDCSPWDAILALSISELRELAKLPHIDVLAVFLMRLQLQNNLLEEIELIALTTWWLNQSVVQGGAVKSVAQMLLPILKEFQPRMGSLESFIVTTHALSAQEHYDRAFRLVYFESHFINIKK